MNKTPLETLNFIEESKEIIDFAFSKGIDIAIAPTYLSLSILKENINEHVMVFAQNVHYKDCGAYTGEVSCSMLKEIKVDGSIIGHSERRTYDNETSSKCNLKIKSLLENNLIPLYCVGETEEEFNSGLTYKVIETQLKEGLINLPEKDICKIIIAYEPIWSIGTGKNANPTIAQNVCQFIRKTISNLYDKKGEEVRILYGGSVNPENIKSYLSQNDVDGALVGGASLKVDLVKEMIYALCE